MKLFSKIFLILSIVLEILGFILFSLVFVSDVIENGGADWILFLAIALIPLLWTIISAVTLKRVINGRVKVIPAAILMKLTVLLLLSAAAFLSLEDGIYAASLFAITGLFCGFSAFAATRLRNITSAPGIPERYQFKGYNAGNHWYFAAVEYLHKNNRNISELADMIRNAAMKNTQNDETQTCGLTFDEKNKITEYACMPFVYLFQWLIENNHMSEFFMKKFKADDIANVKSGFIPSMYFFKNAMRCKIDRWDISEKIHNFLIWYYEPFTNAGCYRRINEAYLFDYCSIIQSKGADLYCCDYHYDIYRELKEKFDRKYEEYLEFVERDKKFIAGYNKTKTTLNWQLFNKNLEVYANHEPTAEEIVNCKSALNCLNDSQIKQLERMIIRKLALSTPVDFRSDIIPESVHIHEAENNDVYFSVGCGISIDENKIIGFTVKNGVIVNLTCDYEFDMPYCKYENERYELGKNDIDFIALTNQSTVEELCERGELETVEIKIEGMQMNSDSGRGNIIYLTPAAAKIFNENIRRLNILNKAHLINDVNISCSRCENSIVPQAIYFAGIIKNIENPQEKETYRYSDLLVVWE